MPNTRGEDELRSEAPAPVATTPPSRPAALRELAYEAALKAVAEHGGNKKRAAQALGISRSHLYTLLARGGGKRRRSLARRARVISAPAPIHCPCAASPSSSNSACFANSAGRRWRKVSRLPSFHRTAGN
ncbi:helix-turn-helix domain-containing protein [Cupriavidus sp. H18C1]|uniref:helix-turn-helix domain-containing protein n=1 Tax=Cupriavidus sp. H18C1 TaxID=3241601 RepID=UPI003BB8DF48